MKVKTYTLITGASSGIGRGIADKCAENGLNVLLVALKDDVLEKALYELKSQYPDQDFDALGIDMTLSDSPQKIHDWCQSNAYQVDILVNNVGIGNSGAFASRPVDFYTRQLQVNMLTLVALTHLFLPEMQRHSKAYILNVSSLAAFFDIPYKSTYSASKKFVYSFSQSLRKELQKTNVSVTVLCPAAVLTNADVAQRDKELGRVSKLTQQSIDGVAAYGLKRMFDGKAVAIPGLIPKLYRVLGSFVPYRLKINILANAFIKQSR